MDHTNDQLPEGEEGTLVPDDLTPPVDSGAGGHRASTAPAPGVLRVGVPAVQARLAQAPEPIRRRITANQLRWAGLALAFAGLVYTGVDYLADTAGGSTVQDATTPAGAGPVAVLGAPAPARVSVGSAARVARLSIPAIQVETTVAVGTDPGPAPVLWPGTPWPGTPGRAVVAITADLSTLRPGMEVLVGPNMTWHVASTRQVTEAEWAEVSSQDSERTELAMVEAMAFGGRTTRTLVVAWPAR